ncbi:DUF2384 domain-containing protein [Luteimonas sp. 100069]|nr:DUF2384 domain-containing protein [Luteimonas sp. 100069]
MRSLGPVSRPRPSAYSAASGPPDRCLGRPAGYPRQIDMAVASIHLRDAMNRGARTNSPMRLGFGSPATLVPHATRETGGMIPKNIRRNASTMPLLLSLSTQIIGSQMSHVPPLDQAIVRCVEGAATQVFGSSARAKRWLSTTHLILGRTPLELLATPEGILAVKEELGRIEHGIFG